MNKKTIYKSNIIFQIAYEKTVKPLFNHNQERSVKEKAREIT